MSPSTDPVLELSGVHRITDGVDILRGIDWRVDPGQHWVVLGPNGCGKTTLIRIASMWLHPSKGEVTVLGERLGRTDVRSLRTRIGFASASMSDLLRSDLLVRDVVMTARNAALEPWWHSYDDEDRAAAMEALHRVGIGHLADRRFGACSSGERQRVLVARALSTAPGLVLLDEPTAALDLAGRETFVRMLTDLAADRATPPMALVTHHVEEIPAGFTHALLIKDGETLAQGPLDEVLTSSNLSACFGVSLTLERQRGRYVAWADDIASTTPLDT
ncbi:MAG: ATP-binding cassette domain-containing protein [Actinomycetota bacterium]